MNLRAFATFVTILFCGLPCAAALTSISAVPWSLHDEIDGSLAGVTVTSAKPKPILLYVGPVESEVRDGFTDPVPPGLMDSVKDLHLKLRRYKGIKIVNRPEGADLVLRVVARRRSYSEAGAMAMPIGTAVVAVPLHATSSFVETILYAGDHRKPIVGVESTWGDAAGAVVKELVAWVNANHTALLAAREKEER